MFNNYGLTKRKNNITSIEHKSNLLKELEPILPKDSNLKDGLFKFSAEQLQIFYDRYTAEYQDTGTQNDANGLQIIINFVIFSVTLFLGLKLLFFKSIIERFGDIYTSYFFIFVFSFVFGLVISIYLKMEMGDAIKDRIDSANLQNTNNAFKIYEEINKIKIFIRSR